MAQEGEEGDGGDGGGGLGGEDGEEAGEAGEELLCPEWGGDHCCGCSHWLISV